MTGTQHSKLQMERLARFLNPTASDPTYLVLKAHLLAEEVLYSFVQQQSHRPNHLENARLSFAQLLALCRALHKYSNDDWWGWGGLKKLNALRNLLAHNLEPKDLTKQVVDFSLLVAEGIGAVSNSKTAEENREIADEYERLAVGGTHPFVLAIVGLHVAVSTTFGFTPDRDWTALQ